MRTIEMQVFTFDELSEKAKQTALNDNRHINTSCDWWRNTYEDATEIGLDIKSFDFNYKAEGILKINMLDSIQLIHKNHGKVCESYKLATRYQNEWGNLVKKYSDGVNTNKVAEVNETEFDEEADELEKSYLKELCAEYLKILRLECDYLETDEAIEETFDANGYEFTAYGKIYE